MESQRKLNKPIMLWNVSHQKKTTRLGELAQMKQDRIIPVFICQVTEKILSHTVVTGQWHRMWPPLDTSWEENVMILPAC